MINEKDAFNALCREGLYPYTMKAFSIIEPATPFEDNWHIGCVSEHLEAVYNKQIQDLIINIPPRTLKSVHVAQIFPSWVIGKEPSHQFIGASYAHSLAERNVMKTRQIIQSDWYQQCFDVEISKDNNQKDYFTTTQNGQYKGTGIGGTITGYGAQTLILDDPINPKEAMSDTIRTGAINEIRSTLFSRFNKYSDRRFVMIMQRLHEADPTGDLIADGGYYHLKLPAIAPKHYIISLNGKTWEQQEGEYLTPRLDKESLDKIRTDMGDYNFVGQYLQEPVPIGGGEFKLDRVNYYPQGSIKPREMNLYILVDPSGGDEVNKKKKKNSDWTAMVVVGLAKDNNFYLLDIIRDRLNPTERVNTLFILHRKWNALCGKPPKVGYEKYGMMTDTHYIKDKMVSDAYHFTLVELGGSMQKEERIRRIIPDLEMGRWFFPQSLTYVDGEGRVFDLVRELVDSEMPNFPRARFDDMLDALSRIYEDNLNKVFPQISPSTVQRSYDNINSNGTSWEDW
jgi:predicted phage terminase large subunit-like protein